MILTRYNKVHIPLKVSIWVNAQEDQKLAQIAWDRTRRMISRRMLKQVQASYWKLRTKKAKQNEKIINNQKEK